MTRLGTVAPNGGIYFEHIDINECRAFLRDHGLRIAGCDDDEPTYLGWHCDGYRGLIDFHNNRWYAAIFQERS